LQVPLVFNGINADSSYNVFVMKELKQVTVIGLGLLGGSISLTVLRCFPGVKTVGFSHRSSTRTRAGNLAIASEIADDIRSSVRGADIVVLATPVLTFEQIFSRIADVLPKGCIVTDVGSTKVIPNRWAAKLLPDSAYYVGSHPVAGSEQRGIEFARDDLFERSSCILTPTKNTNPTALRTVKMFWSKLGCKIKLMTPSEHDRVMANISHLPHIAAAALINSNKAGELKFAGRGFLDTSRIASGPANVWADVLLTNAGNSIKGIDKLTQELAKIKAAIKSSDRKRIEKLLDKARDKRAALVRYKVKNKEIIP